jgi:hypothetical protein
MWATTTINDRLSFSMVEAPGDSQKLSSSIFTSESVSTAAPSITISASVIPYASTAYSEVRLAIRHDLIVLAKAFAVALAVGLDVLAVSVGVGVARLARNVSFKLGLAFASSEITMQVLGYELGAGAGRVLGEVGACAGFALLALVGAFMIRNSLRNTLEAEFEATHGLGLLMTSLSISLEFPRRGRGASGRRDTAVSIADHHIDDNTGLYPSSDWF